VATESTATLVSAANSARLFISAPPQYFFAPQWWTADSCVSVPAPLTPA
jgi:hypothetical protein